MSDVSDNTTNASGDSVTVSDMAQRLGVTLPRLMRLLKRPEYASLTWQEERQTRTGTRTVTCVSVSVEVQLRAAFSEGVGEQKHKRLPDEALSFDDARVRALIEALTREQRERIEEQAHTIADLRADKAELQREKVTLTETIALLEQEKELLEAYASTKEKPVFGDSTHPGVSTPAEEGQTVQDKPQGGQNEARQTVPLPWWKRLFGAGDR